MSYQRFIKVTSNYIRTFSHFNQTMLHRLQNFKCPRNPQYLSFANFGTSIIRCSDGEPTQEDEDLYYFEAGRRLAKHVEDPNLPKCKITLVTKDGDEIPIEANVGMTVLRAALKYNVPIEAACEGKKACTTCHCYVEESIRDYFTPPDLDEEDLLDVAPFCKPTSRLSCQMKIIKHFDHARIHLPQATLNFAVDKEAKKQS